MKRIRIFNGDLRIENKKIDLTYPAIGLTQKANKNQDVAIFEYEFTIISNQSFINLNTATSPVLFSIRKKYISAGKSTNLICGAKSL